MSGRRGNGRGRNSHAGLKGSLGMLKSSLHGHANSLKATNPPPFTRIPFNSIVVEDKVAEPVPTPIFSIQSGVISASPTTGVISTSTIRAALKAQLLLSGQDDLTFKIQRIDLWSMGGTTVIPTIRGEYYGLNPQVSGLNTPVISVSSIKVLEDIGTPGAAAAVVSYSYPRDQADIPLAAQALGTPVPIVTWTISNDAITVFARYHLLWNTAKELTIDPVNL